MGHGIIFVGGNESEDEREIYSYDGKWKDNWGMYQHKYSEVKSSRIRKGTTIQQQDYEIAKCLHLVRIYANELHSLKVRGKISRQLHGRYPSVSENQIYRALRAYYECCLEPKFMKKGQINTLRMHLEDYLRLEGVSVKIRNKFIVAEKTSSLKHDGKVEVANVVNSIHRCFLLNKGIPQKMEELAIGSDVRFTKNELIQLSELYSIILNKLETGTVEQICLNHKFSFLSMNALVLKKRISEFNS